jgi:hypothetical protein
MMKKTLGLMVMAAALTAGGCLQKDTTHTLYLEPEGSVRWMAIEKDVRSDENDPSARRGEEEAYLASAAAGSHDIGRALAALNPTGQRTRVLRAQRPFVVTTEADFPSIQDLFERILADLRVPGQVTLTRGKGGTTLRIHVDLTTDAADDLDPDSPVAALCEELSRFRLVLTRGRFVSAEGFTLSGDGATAALNADPAAAAMVDLALTWGNPIPNH